MSCPLTSKSKCLTLAVGLLLLVGFLYIDTFRWLIGLWSHDKPYSHGFFVPLISLYLVWIQRDQFRCLSSRFNFARLAGGLIILLCCFFLLLGRIGAIMQLELLSLFFIFPGIILFLCGWRVLASFWFPLFYLQFMIPWIDPFLEYVYPVARRIAAVLGAWFLSFKYPVFHDNTSIYLPDISLSVVEGCSGVNFFISVTAVGLLLAYLTQKSWARVFVVVLFGAVLTVFVNGIRVALAGIMGQKYGVEMLHGPGHIFRGWFVAQVGWVGIFFINWLIARIPHASSVPLYRKQAARLAAESKSIPEEQGCFGRCPYFLLLVTFLAGFGVYLYGFAIPQPREASLPLESVPVRIETWTGRKQVWFDSHRYFPGAASELFRKYRNGDGKIVQLYLGYFERQTVNARLVNFRSRMLLENRDEIILQCANKKVFKVNYSRPTIGKQRYHLLTWYVFPGAVIADPLRAKLQGLTDALLHRHSNGLVVLVATPVLDRSGEGGNEVPQYLVQFSGQIAPAVIALLQGRGGD